MSGSVWLMHLNAQKQWALIHVLHDGLVVLFKNRHNGAKRSTWKYLHTNNSNCVQQNAYYLWCFSVLQVLQIPVINQKKKIECTFLISVFLAICTIWLNWHAGILAPIQKFNAWICDDQLINQCSPDDSILLLIVVIHLTVTLMDRVIVIKLWTTKSRVMPYILLCNNFINNSIIILLPID